MNDKTYSYCQKCKSINLLSLSKIQTQSPLCGSCQAPINLHALVSDVDFDGLMKMIQKSKLPVIVDFWAPWCGPCKQFAPTYEEASKNFGGKIVFVKINTEAYPQASSHFNIRGIPTLTFFTGGKEKARQSGAFPLDQLKMWLNQLIS